MAVIFYPTTSNFSTATPQKVVSSFTNTASDSFDAANTARYIAFTPSEAGTIEGVFLGFWINGTNDTHTITANLQTYSGTWGDVAGVTKTLSYIDADIFGSFGVGRNQNGTLRTTFGNYCWIYFQFGSTTSITTDASTWRIKIQSSNDTARLLKNGTDYAHAVVLTDTTSYTSGDTAFLKNFQTFTVDQSMTFATVVAGVQTKIDWASSPASSYTLAITALRASRNFQLGVGTSASPIPYAQQATVTIGSISGNQYWTAPNNFEYEIYGEKPTEAQIFGYLSATANASQATIITTEDKTGIWNVGDTVHVTGGFGSTNWESRTISAISGTTITLNSNLTTAKTKRYAVINVTNFDKVGVVLSITGTLGMASRVIYSGIKLTTGMYIIANASSPIYDRALPMVLDTVYIPSTVGGSPLRISGDNSWVKTSYSNARGGSSFTNVYIPSSTAYTYFDLFYGAGQGITMTNVFCTANASYYWLTWTMTDSTFTNLQMSGSLDALYKMGIFTITGCTFTSCLGKAQSSSIGGIFSITGNVNTFTTCYYDTALTAITWVSGVDNVFKNCEFGQNDTVTNTIASSTNLFRVIFDNCKGVTAVNGNTISDAVLSSYVRSADDNQTTSKNLSWWKYGRIISTGDSLTDTTVHTSGTGKFAIRFEPLSSTNNLTWDFTVPTGNIQNKTMTIGVWCKINSATYYAGTHQLPRLTIDYDNGTTAYHQAGETTDWQLLFVSFTPTTTYGQVTVTLSGRTDATTTNAYIYFDDFGVAYPPSVALDLGGMDNWSNALPVVPPISIPISANTVAESVWRQLTASSWGTGSMGEQVKDGTKKIKIIDDGEIPIYES